MTHHEARMGVGCHPTPPDYTPRLRLKPKAPRTGYVDGPGGCGATKSDQAHATMMAAAAPKDDSRVEGLLTVGV